MATDTAQAGASAAAAATPNQPHQRQAALQRLNTGDRTNAVRLVAMADRSLAGPVASLFVGHALDGGAAGGGGPLRALGGGGGGLGSGSGSGSASADASPTHLGANGGHGGGGGNGGGVRFTVTRTEDAMDSVLPTAAEDLLSRAVLAPAARFAAHKLSFDLAAAGGG